MAEDEPTFAPSLPKDVFVVKAKGRSNWFQYSVHNSSSPCFLLAHLQFCVIAQMWEANRQLLPWGLLHTEHGPEEAYSRACQSHL
jgi:hypothetical protein